ncbi:hypothetical protein JW721_06275 [Candidatus Micrarchaeota archaeon]|nr:hypothetical protein [Candidatus Micrarchaeota archaeon]
MGRRRKLITYPKAFACGMLQDGGRVLFLVGKERFGRKRLLLPNVKINGREDAVAKIKEAFSEQAGIDAQVHEVIFEGGYNAGSRKYKKWIPLLVFEISAKRMQAKPSGEFEGFKWLGIKDALAKEKKKELFLEHWVSELIRKMAAT